MAQTGYTPILIYSSSTTTNAPAAGSLTNSTLGSELAINITDGKLFYKDNANAVQVIAWKTTPTTAGGTGLTSYTAGDLLYYASGTTLTKLAIGASGRWLGSSGTAPQWNAPAALTKTDDTNVTLTLGGSASTALLNAASLTLGWTGTLAVSRGGTGTGTAFTTGSIIFAGASGVYSQDNANLFWDDSNNRLGVGTAAPNRNVEFAFSGGTTLGVSNSAQGAGILYGRIALYSTAFSNSYIDYGGEIRSYSGGGVDYSDLRFYTASAATSAERMRIDSSGNVQLITAGTSILNSSGNKILNQTGSVLQVVQGTLATGTTTTSTSFVDTGLTVSITPSSSSSKVMVIACCAYILNDGSNRIEFQLLRGASVLQLSGWGANVRTDGSITFSYLDSPATTSSTTYKVQFRTSNAATTAYISNSNNTSSIVAMEIAA